MTPISGRLHFLPNIVQDSKGTYCPHAKLLVFCLSLQRVMLWPGPRGCSVRPFCVHSMLSERERSSSDHHYIAAVSFWFCISLWEGDDGLQAEDLACLVDSVRFALRVLDHLT